MISWFFLLYSMPASNSYCHYYYLIWFSVKISHCYWCSNVGELGAYATPILCYAMACTADLSSMRLCMIIATLYDFLFVYRILYATYIYVYVYACMDGRMYVYSWMMCEKYKQWIKMTITTSKLNVQNDKKLTYDMRMCLCIQWHTVTLTTLG